MTTEAAVLARAHRRLEQLYEISKLLTGFTGAATAVPAILAIVRETLPLCSAIFMHGGHAPIVWQAEDLPAIRLRAAKGHARLKYAYLVGDAAAAEAIDVDDAPGQPEAVPVSATGAGRIMVLPLAVAGRPAFGVLQVESVERLIEGDLMFLNAIVNQLAVALDRHQAIEQRQAELEARRRVSESGRIAAEGLQERFAALVDNLDRAYVWSADATTFRIDYISARVEPLLGHPRARWLAEPDLWRRCVHPEDYAAFEDTLRRAVAEREDQRCTYRCLTADGRLVWLHTGVHVALLDSARPQLQCVSFDITADKAAEVALRVAVDQAGRAVLARDDLLALVSHDLKNPLSSILYAIESMANTAARDDDQRSRKSIDIIRRAAGTMSRLITDLLDVASIEAGKLAVELQPVAIGALIADAIDAIEPAATRKSLRLVSDVAAQLPAVFADRGRIQQVLGNLLGNAIKFTAAEGVVTVAVRPLAGALEIAVTDTGPGISADGLAHVFDRFWQARTTARHGTGLGLSIVHGIVHAHGGEVRVASTVGVGSTFAFTLALAPSPSPSP